jgi:hypothetical protein
MKSSTSTLNCLVLSDSSEEQVQVNVAPPRPRRSIRGSKSAENAIYAYIRAIRALGRTNVNTLDIADALSLTPAEVNRALSSLKKKGVKTLNA